MCGDCQLPLDETLDPDREGWYLVETQSCAACRAREIETGQSKSEPGMKVTVRSDPSYVKRS